MLSTTRRSAQPVTLGRASEREVVLVRDLRAALQRLNPGLPESAREQASIN